MTRGLSRKETAPERQQRLPAVQLQPPPLLRQSVRPQHERPASLQYVGHRITRSECLPGAPSGGERGRREPPPGEGGAGAAKLRRGLLGPLPPRASRPQRESLHRASWGLSSPSVSRPRPSSAPPSRRPRPRPYLALLFHRVDLGREGWSLTSLYPGRHRLPIAELLALPTLSLVPLPFILTSLAMVGGPSLIPYHRKPVSSSKVPVVRTGGQKLLATLPVCPGFVSSTPSPPACS